MSQTTNHGERLFNARQALKKRRDKVVELIRAIDQVNDLDPAAAKGLDERSLQNEIHIMKRALKLANSHRAKPLVQP